MKKYFFSLFIVILIAGCSKGENTLTKKKNQGKISDLKKPVELKIINRREAANLNIGKYKDSYWVRYVAIKNDKLIVRLSYGGGCKEHSFKVIWSGKYLESQPPQVYLYLYHNANKDNCEAKVNTTLNIDLSRLLPCVIVLKGYNKYKKSIRYKLD